MTTPAEFDLFFSDLGSRRKRLLAMVTDESGTESAVVQDVLELGEDLIVAEEELRAQQEELEDARRRLTDLAVDRNVLLQSSTEPYVVARSSRPTSAAASARIDDDRARCAVATTSRSALAAPGFSGGASGSSQSPNWNTVSHRPSGERSRSTRRTCADIESSGGGCSRTVRRP